MGKKTRPILLVLTFNALKLQEFETANELQLFRSITALASIDAKFSVYFSIKLIFLYFTLSLFKIPYIILSILLYILLKYYLHVWRDEVDRKESEGKRERKRAYLRGEEKEYSIN